MQISFTRHIQIKLLPHSHTFKTKIEYFFRAFYYRHQTKLREGNVFTGVCLFMLKGLVSLVPCPFPGGGVSISITRPLPRGEYLGGWVCPVDGWILTPLGWVCPGVGIHPPRYMEYYRYSQKASDTHPTESFFVKFV